MKKIDVATLARENPELFKTVEKVVKINSDNVVSHLEDFMHPGEGLIAHSVFCRLEDDEKKILYLEIQTYIVGNPARGFFLVRGIVLYDSEEEYEKAREECVKDSVRRFGMAWDEGKIVKL